MTRLAALAACLSLTACGTRLPDPSIRSVSPSVVEQGHAAILTLEVDAVFPFVADYGEDRLDVDEGVQLSVASFPAELPAVQPDGRITGVLPFGLSVGRHDVTIQLADGRGAVLRGGLEVVPAPFPDGYVLDPIPTQERFQAFDITVRAVGEHAAGFDGVVRFSASRGGILPTTSDPFVNGVLHQRVVLTASHPAMVISVEDAQGNTGSSDPFRVSP